MNFNFKNFDFKNMDLRKIDLFKWSERIPSPFRLRALSRALDWMIPFNGGLGLELKSLSGDEVIVESPERRKRRNHVGGAHACFLALISEYPAGLLLAQRYSTNRYRLILSNLKIEYFKQGHGALTAVAKAPVTEANFVEGEAFIDMQTTITNVKQEVVAHCETRWQVKEWARVRKKQ